MIRLQSSIMGLGLGLKREKSFNNIKVVSEIKYAFKLIRIHKCAIEQMVIHIYVPILGKCELIKY